jgi:hypothetical protein
VVIRKVLRWGWIPVIAAFLYSGWVLYRRGAENRQIDATHEQRRAEQDAEILEKLGGGELKVVTFYANPPVLRRGQRGLLCYGVVNAKTVATEPPIPDLGPALSRCVEASPAQTTTYTLTAEDEKGNKVSSSAIIRVE